MAQTLNLKNPMTLPRMCATLLVGIVMLMNAGCSQETAPPPERQSTTTEGSNRPEKLQWADMLLQPGDSSKTSWVNEMKNWPDTITLDFNTSGATSLGDLEWRFDGEAFENSELPEGHPLFGAQIVVTLAARHIPEYELMQDFVLDSIVVFPGDASEPAGVQYILIGRRKYMQGVWQQEYLPLSPRGTVPQFEHGQQLRLLGLGRWGDHHLRISFPSLEYQKRSALQVVD